MICDNKNNKHGRNSFIAWNLDNQGGGGEDSEDIDTKTQIIGITNHAMEITGKTTDIKTPTTIARERTDHAMKIMEMTIMMIMTIP